jgi:ribosomal protein S18 acetylase RimI-like enzyme
VIALVSDAASLTAIPASRYSFEALAQIYNASRVDYIVPMPMNARRMAEYVSAHDVDLDASFVAVNAENEPCAVGMLGWRERRGWVTRLGVIPERRGRHVGRFMLNSLLDAAQSRGASLAQLEVIEGNAPAHALFLKTGFQETRRLYVLRRPPSALPASAAALLVDARIEPLDTQACLDALEGRDRPISWLEETESMQKTGTLEGLAITLEDGQRGAVVFCRLPLQLSHITPVAPVDASDALKTALAALVHHQHPKHDTKLENLDADSRFLAAFQSVGYVVDFRRIEMFRFF